MPAEASVAVRTLFAPFDRTTEEYLAFVNSARQSVFILIYGMHLPLLTEALIAKHQAGVKVNIILDHSQSAGRAEAQEVQKLVDAGVPLLIGTSPVHGQILHTKATIIDENAVESGSWNYSLSASQQSNTLTFVHDADYARSYLDHWHRIRGFIILHDAIYQPKGEVAAADVPAADVLAASVANAAGSAAEATGVASAHSTPAHGARPRKTPAASRPAVARTRARAGSGATAAAS